MAMQLRYYGEFVSRKATLWRVEILQEADEAYDPEELSFPAEEPLVIEWPKVDKLEPVRSSNATLKIISQADRKFVDLYTVNVGSIRMDVYCAGSLYWSGTIDTELYSEPFSYLNNYEVSLTFSDFAILDRMSYTGAGLVTVESIITQCLSAATFNYSSIVKHISTLYGATSSWLSLIQIQADNFYDEDGEAMTLRETLDELLRPFDLHMIQKGGKIYIYDNNCICYPRASIGLGRKNIVWASNDAELGVDTIYNNVRVTFSPYGKSILVKGEVTEDDDLTATSGGLLVRTNYEKEEGVLIGSEGFRFHHAATMDSNMTLSNGAEFFQIRSIYSGEDETGVVWAVRAGNCGMKDNGAAFELIVNNNAPIHYLNSDGDIQSRTIITLPRVYLPYMGSSRTKYRLRINLSFLFDCRYNPYESEKQYNEDGNVSNMKDWCNFGYVPFLLTIRDAQGTALYHYNNWSIMNGNNYRHTSANNGWEAGEGVMGSDAFLSYYDRDDRKSATGFGGWKKNKQSIGHYAGELPSTWERMEDGEYIELPPCGGYLDLKIGSGINQFDNDNRTTRDIYQWVRWVMYKDPSITICYVNGTEVNNKDYEDVAWLNTAAKEECKLDTYVGTLPEGSHACFGRGLLYDLSGNILFSLKRENYTNKLERLLIGTIYSNYASRHKTLSGTMEAPRELYLMNDDSYPNDEFMILEEVEDVAQEESTVVAVEVNKDCYEGVEYEN